MLGAAILAILALSSPSALAAKQAAAGYFDYPEIAIVKIRAQAAQDLKTFLSSNRNTEVPHNERLVCRNNICGFLIAKQGEIIPLQKGPQNESVVTALDKVDAEQKGETKLSKTDGKPSFYEVTVSGNAAEFLFKFLDVSNGGNAAYDIKIPGIKCTREPVSGTYECSFKVAENGALAS